MIDLHERKKLWLCTALVLSFLSCACSLSPHNRHVEMVCTSDADLTQISRPQQHWNDETESFALLTYS